MADQGLWWKLWTSALDDPDLGNLENGTWAQWAKLALYIKRHGTGGRIELAPPARVLCSLLQVPNYQSLCEIIATLPNVTIQVSDTQEGENEALHHVTNAIVTYENWQHYQRDNSIERVRKFRERVTHKKREEEMRREEMRREEILSSSDMKMFSQNGNGHQPKNRDETLATEEEMQTSASTFKKHRTTSIPLQGPWVSVAALIHKYNEETPDELAACTKESEGIIDKARKLLRQFPEEEFWTETFEQIHASLFLRGVRPDSQGKSFHCDLPWILSRGKDGIENVIKIHDGRYHN